MPATSSYRRARRRIGGAACAFGALGAMALVGWGAAPAGAADPGVVLTAAAPIGGVQPGSEFGVPASFTNTGSTALDKVWLSYRLSHGLSPADVPSNCEQYVSRAGDETPETTVVSCEFDQPVAPGVVYAPEHALSVKALDSALYDEVFELVSGINLGPGDNTSVPVPGTAPAVKLVELPGGTPPAPGSAKDYTTVQVTAANTADFQLAATGLKGKVGESVPLKVTFTNAGPAWVAGEPGAAVTHVHVTMPQGTTVTKASGFCRKLAAGSYDCGTSNFWVDENGGDTYTFTVRIDKAVPGAKGSASFAADRPRPFDRTPANDTAAILLTVPGATAAPSPTGDTTTTAAGTTGSSPDTQLANTGSGPALPLTALAAAAAALGAATLLTGRRRSR